MHRHECWNTSVNTSHLSVIITLLDISLTYVPVKGNRHQSKNGCKCQSIVEENPNSTHEVSERPVSQQNVKRVEGHSSESNTHISDSQVYHIQVKMVILKIFITSKNWKEGVNVVALVNRFKPYSVKCWAAIFCIIIMTQLKFIYNSLFKDSHSQPIHTSFPIIASNVLRIFTRSMKDLLPKIGTPNVRRRWKTYVKEFEAEIKQKLNQMWKCEYV